MIFFAGRLKPDYVNRLALYFICFFSFFFLSYPCILFCTNMYVYLQVISRRLLSHFLCLSILSYLMLSPLVPRLKWLLPCLPNSHLVIWQNCAKTINIYIKHRLIVVYVWRKFRFFHFTLIFVKGTVCGDIKGITEDFLKVTFWMMHIDQTILLSPAPPIECLEWV